MNRAYQPKRNGLTRFLGSILGLVLLGNGPCLMAQADAETGESIYKARCASCHGAQGQGTKKYPKALIGDKSIAQLSQLISKTMPEDDPGSCSGPEADRVASYIHDTFYSRIARERNRPARIELARLTVNQYRNSVADLIGSFRWQGNWGSIRGLKGEYFAGRHFAGDKRVLERIDPEINFSFGTGSPVPGRMEPHEFMMRWNGSILAPQTGEYELIIHTEHAVSLWVNDSRHPLIDAWVKSGNETEYRGTVQLIAGHMYPLRLEYAKAKQGVDDSKTNKSRPKPVVSSIILEWKPPHRSRQVIPAYHLSPASFPEEFALKTPFPPDDRSYGWERGTTVSREWDQAATEAAFEVADYVMAHLPELAKVKEISVASKKSLQEFCLRFAERAFRHPLSEALKQRYIDRQFESAKDLETAVKRVILLVLKSPHFLYREVTDNENGFETASRLAFGLWDSLPDQELFQAAASGQLATHEQVRQQAQRMLSNPRTNAKIARFWHRWLKIDPLPDLTRPASKFPGFDPALVADLQLSLEQFLVSVWNSPGADFRQLLLSQEIPVNARLARYYHLPPNGIWKNQEANLGQWLLANNPILNAWQLSHYGDYLSLGSRFEKLKLDPTHRAGVLTHPFLLATFSYTSETSPIHRGVFLARGILGVSLKPPPEAVAPLAADLHPLLTTRERVTLQTRGTSCMTCHSVVNPLGFTLEHFDAVGRFRNEDRGRPIDSSGTYLTRSGQMVNFNGAQELARFMVTSDEVHSAFVEQLFHHLVQQPVRAYGSTTLADLRQRFESNGFDLHKLTIDIVTGSALAPRLTVKNDREKSTPLPTSEKRE